MLAYTIIRFYSYDCMCAKSGSARMPKLSLGIERTQSMYQSGIYSLLEMHVLLNNVTTVLIMHDQGLL